MKKILIIYPGFPHYRKGIIEELLDDKYNDYYFVGDENMMRLSIKAYAFNDSSKFYHIPSLRIKNFFFHRKLLRYIIQNDFDLYIFHSSPFWITIFIAFFILKIKGKKCYNWTHGLLSNEVSLKSNFYLKFYNLFDGLLLYGNTAKNNMIEKGFSEEKMDVIYNSLNYKEQIKNRGKLAEDDFLKIRKNIFGSNFYNPQLIFIGRLTKQKKLSFLIELIEKLNDKGQEFNLLFVGDGLEKQNLMNQVALKRIGDQVKFYGPSYDEFEIYGLLASSECCISPGEIGLTAIHSLTYGTPVISHSSSGFQMPEFESIIDGFNGALFEYNNIDSLVDKTIEWFDNNKDRAIIRKNCYKIIDEKFNPKNQSKIINNFISK